MKSWNIYLKDDGLEENHEKFEVVLKAQKNTVLGQRQRATVEIVDPRGGTVGLTVTHTQLRYMYKSSSELMFIKKIRCVDGIYII